MVIQYFATIVFGEKFNIIDTVFTMDGSRLRANLLEQVPGMVPYMDGRIFDRVRFGHVPNILCSNGANERWQLSGSFFTT